MYAAAGKSPTHELLWSWAQQNKTVADLMRVLEEMGHYRALDLFRSHGAYTLSMDVCVQTREKWNTWSDLRKYSLYS